MTPSPSAPKLSVVVGLIAGQAARLAACLKALQEQEDPPEMEILVPYDAPCAEVTQLQSSHPEVQFLLAEDLDTAAARAGSSREHHDTLRTLGLKAARGQYIALTEDHAIQEKRWCRGLVELLDEHLRVAAIGGAVECGSSRWLNRAVYYCDFGRYQNPLPEGPAEYVSDSNVVYRREALQAIAEVWADDYHETLVHWALVEKGHEIWLTPKVEVWQSRGNLRLGKAFHERYVWGRSFAGTRVTGVGLGKRLVYAAFCPALPLLMTARLLRGALTRKRHLGRFLLALPLISLLQSAWAYGEWIGYLTGRPK
jgi:hypothetical protein